MGGSSNASAGAARLQWRGSSEQPMAVHVGAVGVFIGGDRCSEQRHRGAVLGHCMRGRDEHGGVRIAAGDGARGAMERLRHKRGGQRNVIFD